MAKNQQKGDYARAQARYDGNDGLIARFRALGELESHSPGIRLEVLLLEGLHHRHRPGRRHRQAELETPSYNRLLEAARKKVMMRAALEEEKAHDVTELRRAERQAVSEIKLAWLDAKVHVAFAGIAAWTRVSEQKIHAWEAAQTGSLQNGAAAGPGGGRPPPWAGPGGWQPPPWAGPGGRAAPATPRGKRRSRPGNQAHRLGEASAATPPDAGEHGRTAEAGGVVRRRPAGRTRRRATRGRQPAHTAVAGGWLVAAALTAAAGPSHL